MTQPDHSRTKRLIADLDSNQFSVRKQAVVALAEMGEAAEPALKQLLKESPPLEVQQRAQNLLERLDANGATLRLARALAILEDIDSAKSRGHLQTLANGLPEARTTVEAKASMERLKSKAKR